MAFIGMVEIIVHVLTLKTMRTKHIKNDVLFKMFCYHIKYMNYRITILHSWKLECLSVLVLCCYTMHIFKGFFFTLETYPEVQLFLVANHTHDL